MTVSGDTTTRRGDLDAARHVMKNPALALAVMTAECSRVRWFSRVGLMSVVEAKATTYGRYAGNH